ncbi:insulinase family protein [Candidatus Woesearchaeota archaeon]|nr:insulinase family protein [Candidatus Woesearchaeota archaeon]
MKTYTFANGLEVVHLPQKSKTVSVHVLVKAGSVDEGDHEHGISHFIEHLVFEGTKTRSALAITREVEGLGGDIGAYTTNERTCFYVKSLSEHFAKSVEILADILFNPLFAEKSIEKERGVILSEESMRRDEPRHYQWDLLSDILFKGYPMSHAVIGSRKHIRSISREDILAYYQKHYHPSNMIIAVVGAAERVKSTLECFFGKDGTRVVKVPILVPPLKQNCNLTHKKRGNHEYLVLGYRTTTVDSKDAAVLDVLRAVLGKGMSGRLFEEVRNKRGLAYDVGAYDCGEINFGFFGLYVSCEANRLALCEQILKKELRRAAEIGKNELDECKRFIVGEHVFEEEDNQRLADTLAFYAQAGNVHLYSDYLKQVEKVSSKDLEKVLEQYFKRLARVHISNR